MLLLGINTNAQIAIDTSMTPTELVQQVLLGNGVSVSNITFNGVSGDELNGQIGRFTGGSNVIEFPEAVVMRTGHVESIENPLFFAPFPFPDPNVTNDQDLMDISSFNVNNCAILEFDFVPNGDSLVFRYVFASTEYTSFTCSSYNDAFGFFISGPGINGPFSNNSMNIALVPDTDIPVGVNTINGGEPTGGGQAANCESLNPNWVADSIYYVSNIDVPEGDVDFNGMTVTLTAYAEVQCGQEYHIKLAIGDATDTALDSGVFLEAGSFTSNSVVQVNLDIPVGVNDSTLYEGCGEAYLQFIRPNSSAGLEETAYLNITGTATNGVDFVPMLPDSVVFPPGVDTVFFSLSSLPDGIVEGQEFVNVEITNIASNCSGAVLTSDFQFYINEADPLEVTGYDGALVDCNDEISLVPTVTGGYGEYGFLWSTGEETDSIMASPGTTQTIFVTVSDTCGVPNVQAAFDIEVPVYPPVVVDLGEDFEVNSCDVTVNLPSTVTGGFGNYYYSWIVDDAVVGIDPFLDYQITNDTEIELIVTDDCDVPGYDDIFISTPDILVTAVLPDIYTAESCLEDIMMPVISDGGIGTKTYTWLVDNEIQYQGQAVFFMYNPAMGQEVVIIAEDECENSASDTTVVALDYPQVTIRVSPDTSICEDTYAELFAEPTGGSGGYHIFWEGTESENGFYEVYPEGSRFYNVMISDTCGMEGIETVQVDVRNVRADFDYKYFDYYSLAFTNYSRATNPYYIWDFGDGTESNEVDPSHSYTDMEEHDIVLTVVDDIGCIDTAMFTAIPPVELFIPNSFTPNGDGINDLFGAEGTNVYEFEMIIYDRWGKIVFQSSNMEEKWNGSDEGDDYYVENSIYTYIITYKGKKEEDAVELTGFVTVVR
jgi:gliding motility-associated-like protein